jgi:hypothetical protein
LDGYAAAQQASLASKKRRTLPELVVGHRDDDSSACRAESVLADDLASALLSQAEPHLVGQACHNHHQLALVDSDSRDERQEAVAVAWFRVPSETQALMEGEKVETLLVPVRPCSPRVEMYHSLWMDHVGLAVEALGSSKLEHP